MSNSLSLSYVHGASDTPLTGRTIDDCLNYAVEHYPDLPALIVAHDKVRWTYAQLREQVDVLSAGFVALGLETGDRVGLLAPNRADWLVIQLATAKIGLILVNINPAYRQAELAYALEKVDCRALITVNTFKSSDYLATLNALLPSLSISKPGKLSEPNYRQLQHIITIDAPAAPGCWTLAQVKSLDADVHRQKADAIAATLQFDDIINIQFTSGTTGSPKASALTHHNIVNNAYFVGRQMRLQSHDRICIPVPMYHCFGMVLGTLCALTHGACSVFTSEGFDSLRVLATIEKEKCTVLHGVPTMFIAELEHPQFSEFDLTSLRTGVIAGAPCPMELMKRIMADMHLNDITIAYGMTETGPVSFQTSLSDSIDRRVGTVGQVLAHVEVKIVDESSRVVPRGVTGELLTRGYSVMPRYWNDEERTHSAIDSSGWIASGDIATLDDAGYCQIVGRSKDMLIRGGENIFPREIEEYLYQHPAIEQVEVFGVPDDRLGEQVCAWIKLHDGHQLSEQDVVDFCRDKIAHFKIPAYVRFVESFPMTVTGKVKKFVMRETMTEQLSKQSDHA